MCTSTSCTPSYYEYNPVRLIMLTWKKIRSREAIGKFLLKLPGGMFPSYRCTISEIPENDNLSPGTKISKKRRFCKLHCCEDDSFENGNIPSPPPFPYHLLSLTEVETIKRPKMTLEDLASVKLKKPSVQEDPKTPVRDMTQILRKRYNVMHSPTPKKLFDLLN
ncbi:hypothetical protein TcasGA2_TC032183 [Tribolium castaneum]|uniref:Uncharacterized protein n=1 Tax=Tribolium castaneum TaxID=7070 RepID=A0A139WN70_TRICA|nr:hypothetical protein TcasGA2_TC032183 [Tribolium castaneum]